MESPTNHSIWSDPRTTRRGGPNQQVRSNASEWTSTCSTPGNRSNQTLQQLCQYVCQRSILITFRGTYRYRGFLDRRAEGYVQSQNIMNLSHHRGTRRSFDRWSGELLIHMYFEFNESVDVFQRIENSWGIFVKCLSVCRLDIDNDDVGQST